MFQVDLMHCELIFCLLTSPKCDLGEVEERMFQVVERHFEDILYFLTNKKYCSVQEEKEKLTFGLYLRFWKF